MTAYLLGVAVEVPFVSTSFYTGPMAAHLGGADISWILGLVVSAVLHYALMPGEPVLDAEPSADAAVAEEARPAA